VPDPLPTAVIFDLDGVIRDWNDVEISEIEVAYGLKPGTILAVGFGTELGRAATTGAMDYRSWMDAVRSQVIQAHGIEVAGALDAWEANVGLVNTKMLQVLRAVRSEATVALLSNGTTRLRRDLAVLDLTDEFDAIFNTAEIGSAKPDPDVFLHVVQKLHTTVHEVLFVDDLELNILGAESVGIRSHQHIEPASTIRFLQANGLAMRGIPSA
ncbi:MAG: HAD-IA family hydrolase, partial [Microthrixaceae bacterium]